MSIFVTTSSSDHSVSVTPAAIAGDTLSDLWMRQKLIETFLSNGRLQINANVGLEGIDRLKQMLDKYEELLKLMKPS